MDKIYTLQQSPDGEVIRMDYCMDCEQFVVHPEHKFITKRVIYQGSGKSGFATQARRQAVRTLLGSFGDELGLPRIVKALTEVVIEREVGLAE